MILLYDNYKKMLYLVRIIHFHSTHFMADIVYDLTKHLLNMLRVMLWLAHKWVVTVSSDS